MQKSEIRKQVIIEHHAASKALQAFLKKGKQQKLHHFRTSVKKLRALADLVQETAPMPHLRKTLQPLRKTFQLSGTIRDSYLHLEMGKSVVADAGYLADQQKEMEKAVDKMKGKQGKHLKKLQQSKKGLLKHLHGVKDFKLNLFYDDELHQLAAQLAQPGSDDQLHACRRRLKILLYDLPVVRPALALPVNESYLDAVQAAIGDWHDNLLASAVFPALRQRTKKLRKLVKTLTNDFYNQVTTPVELPLAQID